MEQETIEKNTVEFNGRNLEFHKEINAKKLIEEVIGKEDHHVYHHNHEYRNRKRQIERWAKKYDDKVKDFVTNLSKQPRWVKGTYKEHEYIIYLSDYGYSFHTEIKCLKNEVGGVDFGIFWKGKEPTSISVGDYANSHRDSAVYYKESHSIYWSYDTKITKAEEIYYKFKDEESKEKEKETGETYYPRSRGLVTINDVVPFVHRIIDDFIKRQENDYKERAFEFRRIFYQLVELKKQFNATPDEDFQAFNRHDTRFNEQKGRTEEITNAISKNLYDKLFTFFKDMPLSVQNTFYKEAIGLLSAGIVAKTYENTDSLDGLRELERKLEQLQ